MDHARVGTLAKGHSLWSHAWWAPAYVPGNAGGVQDGNSHLGEV